MEREKIKNQKITKKFCMSTFIWFLVNLESRTYNIHWELFVYYWKLFTGKLETDAIFLPPNARKETTKSTWVHFLHSHNYIKFRSERPSNWPIQNPWILYHCNLETIFYPITEPEWGKNIWIWEKTWNSYQNLEADFSQRAAVSWSQFNSNGEEIKCY